MPTVPLPPVPQAGSELEQYLDAIGDLSFQLGLDGQVVYGSPGTLRALPAIAPGAHGAQFVVAADLPAYNKALAQALGGSPARADVRLQTPAGEGWHELRFSPCKAVGQVLVVARDAGERYATEAHLRHLATHDALTGLPNRVLLADRIAMIAAQARRNGQAFSVATLGIDGFKKVNDVLGHTVGDALLNIAAARLKRALRDSDTLARVGGDQFIIVLTGTSTEAEIKLVCGRLISTLQSPIEIEGHTIYVGASIGVAVYPDHGEDDVALLARADTAMYRAKETGRARSEIYSPQESTLPEHDISLEAAMFQAVREGEFLLYYQPIVDARTRQIRGFETLMRWMHPTLGMVSPARFIPIAENNGLINLLGAWALKAACVQLKAFEEVAKRPLYVSVNVSPRQFRNDKFLDVLDDALAYSGIKGTQLLLEITEGTLMTDPVHAENILTLMTAREAGIAIDDFGTGYSSLAYLKRFPISVLKIDRAFIKDLPDAPKDGAICNAVLDLAKHLGLDVVAEGVETEAQFGYLNERGCTMIQGYLTGRPMAAHVALEALKDAKYETVQASKPRVETA
jgi:diguanylate cyclase (GGDEF)-like protein